MEKRLIVVLSLISIVAASLLVQPAFSYSPERSQGPLVITKGVNMPGNLADSFGISGRQGVLDKTVLGGLDDYIRIVTTSGTREQYSRENFYRVHEEIGVGGISVKTPMTASSPDEDFEPVFLEIQPRSVNYSFVFDDPLKPGSFVTDSSNERPFKVKIFNKLFRIVSATKNSITADIGLKITVPVGEKVSLPFLDVSPTVDVLVDSVGSDSATITLDSEKKTLKLYDVATIDAIEVKLVGLTSNSATLIIGYFGSGWQASETFVSGDGFLWPCSSVFGGNGMTKSRFLSVGQSVNVAGKSISLKNIIAPNRAEVSVEDESKVVTDGSTVSINGLTIRVQDVTDSAGTEFDTAEIVVFASRECSYNDPDWVWELRNLDTPNPTIAVVFDESINTPEENPPGVDEIFDFPRGIVNITIDSFNPLLRRATVSIKSD